MSVSLLHADAGRLPLADATVDLVVTSPPYWALRSYTDGGEHYDGQIGSEPTPAAYIDSLIECTREWMRVLKPTGSLWVNLGDKYSGAQAQNFGGKSRAGDSAEVRKRTNPKTTGIPAKSLMGFPWRYALRCIDDLGLILRAEVIWSKPNGLPESISDRVRRAHETWFHFVRQPRYFAAVDAIREPHESVVTPGRRHGGAAFGAIKNGGGDGSRHTDGNPLGKLPGSVREVATQPLKVPAELGIDHFAAFPMAWPDWIIRGWSPSGICTACGEGRRPVADVHKTYAPRPGLLTALTSAHGQDGREGARPTSVAVITGEACACPDTTAPTRPAVVLDPFGGTGTTALVAHALGRHGISVDMSADYCRLAAWRTTDPSQLAAAMGVEKPPAERVGQLDLFAEKGVA